MPIIVTIDDPKYYLSAITGATIDTAAYVACLPDSNLTKILGEFSVRGWFFSGIPYIRFQLNQIGYRSAMQDDILKPEIKISSSLLTVEGDHTYEAAAPVLLFKKSMFRMKPSEKFNQVFVSDGWEPLLYIIRRSLLKTFPDHTMSYHVAGIEDVTGEWQTIEPFEK